MARDTILRNNTKLRTRTSMERTTNSRQQRPNIPHTRTKRIPKHSNVDTTNSNHRTIHQHDIHSSQRTNTLHQTKHQPAEPTKKRTKKSSSSRMKEKNWDRININPTLAKKAREMQDTLKKKGINKTLFQCAAEIYAYEQGTNNFFSRLLGEAPSINMKKNPTRITPLDEVFFGRKKR